MKTLCDATCPKRKICRFKQQCTVLKISSDLPFFPSKTRKLQGKHIEL
jgi:hypothetical protein